jgi:cell division protease FtsH
LTACRPGAILSGCPVPDDHNAMTLTDDELTEPTAELTGGDDAHRRPISDVDAWLDGLDSDVRRALRATRRAAGRRRRARNR